MSAPQVFERTGGYLHAQFRTSASSRVASPAVFPFVTISREAGSGGSSLARLLVRKLNAVSARDVLWRVYEGDLTSRALDANHLPRRAARFLPEDRVPELSATIGELVGLHPNLWTMVQKTNDEIRDLAATGHTVLVGRGANFVTAGMPHGLHVRLVAPAEHRARFLADLYNIPEPHAAELNAKCEAARSRYVRAYFNADVSDPHHYDLVINTGRVPLVMAAEMIAARLAAMVGAGR